ncbi:MAG: nucleotidyltransferase domain-containing protein [Chloroflexota bacterium]|nr:nucleotidyltransferase domain-containing protein [Chloroflexota bacterium]
MFGSAATGAFDPVTSDFDSVVDLGKYERGVTMRFVQFAEALLGRKVNLVTEDSIVNLDFRYVVDRARESTYQAGDRPTAA